MPDPGVLVVEDGTGVSGANTYGTRAACDAYHEEMGNSSWISKSATYDTYPDADDIAGDKAMVRGARAIDRIYRGSWKGVQTYFGTQGMDWPRSAVDTEDGAIDIDAIPTDLKHAQFEAALRELASSGSMQPDLARGGAIKRVKAGSAEVEYQDGASATTIFSEIDGLLLNLTNSANDMLLG